MKRIISILLISVILANPCDLWASSANQKHVLLPTAQSALLVDAETGKVLFSRASDLKRAPASTTKLLTALLVCDLLPLDQVVAIPSSVEHVEPTQIHLNEGEHFYVRDLLRAVLIKSANDAAKALAIRAAGSEYAFAQKMNQKVAEIGLKDSKFQNASGLPAEDHYSTAQDLVQIFREAEKNEFIVKTLRIRETYITSLEGRQIYLKNHNKMLWRDSRRIIGKTGWTRNAKHCFVGSIESGKRKIYIAILGSRKKWTDLRYFADRFIWHSPKKSTSAEVKKGGYDVRLVQSALKQAGFFKMSPTGYFGPITKRALTRFQKAHNLSPDGMVGQDTWQVLSRYL